MRLASSLLFVAALSSLAAGCRNRPSTIACTPGDVVAVGCTSTLGRTCSGDPRLSVCDAASVPDGYDCSSSAAGFLGSSDDAEGLCPRVVLTCPTSGRLSVLPDGSGTSWRCEVGLGVLPPTSSVETCTPGTSLVVACTGTVGTTCTGDPTLTICDGSVVSDAESCTRDSGGFLAFNDDTGGRCPSVSVTCPASGRIAVNANPFSSGSTDWSCVYDVMTGGI